MLKKQREHHIVAEQLDSLDGDDRMMAEIAKLLKVRRLPVGPVLQWEGERHGRGGCSRKRINRDSFFP